MARLAEDCNGNCLWIGGRCAECGRDVEPPIIEAKDVKNEYIHNEAVVEVAKVRDRNRLIDVDSETRKTFPMAQGLIDYFPDALAEVSKVSFIGNMKHNPGEPMHHARSKSTDHPDCIARHLVERGGFEAVVIDGVEHRIRHTASLAWRALALLQQELEEVYGLPLPRGARK